MKISQIFILIIATNLLYLFFYRRSVVATLPVIGYLILILMTEIVAGFLKHTFLTSNIWVYNAFTIFGLWFWFYFITRFLVKKQLLFQLSSGIILVVFLYEMFILKSISTISTITFSVGTLMYAFLFLLFSRRLLRDELDKINNSWLLFLVLGLGFYIGFFLDTILYSTGMLSKEFRSGITYDRVLVTIISYFFYIGLAIACWLGYKEQKEISR